MGKKNINNSEELQISIDFSGCFDGIKKEDSKQEAVIDFVEYKKRKDKEAFYRTTERLIEHLQG